MAGIKNFREIRRDGKVIEEGMTLEYMLNLGWAPNKVISLQWENGLDKVEFNNEYGVSAEVFPDRDSVIALIKLNEESTKSRLVVFNADGTLRFEVPNVQEINGHQESGHFTYLRGTQPAPKNCFGVAFNIQSDYSQVHIDMDIMNGKTVGVTRIQR